MGVKETMIAALLLSTTPCHIAKSKEFEHPAWCQVKRGSKLIAPTVWFQYQMDLSASVSPSGKWLSVGLGRFDPPVTVEDGYGNPDSLYLEGRYVLQFFRLGKDKYELQKTFQELATWKFSGWSRSEQYCLIIGGPQRLTMDRLGNDRLFILEPSKRVLKRIFAAPYLDGAKFVGTNRISVVRELMISEPNGKDHLDRVKVTLTLDGKIVNKQRTD